MKKKTFVAVMLAGLLALSGVAQAGMWVGAELGGNFNAYPHTKWSSPFGSHYFQTEIRPSVMGGVTLGYDFVNYGFGAYKYPAWMGCFSFALDYTYNRFSIQDGGPGIGKFFPANSRLNGSESALTFLFMAKYGFMRDSEVPMGRISPYLGIGPALVWTEVDHDFVNADAMNVALVVEPGVRFMVLRNVSIDVAMRYRYLAPYWEDGPISVKANPLHQFSPLVRASLHF